MALLTGCAKTNYSKITINLPEMPIAGMKVANELEQICTEEKCHYLLDYFNKLYIFRVQYLIYKEELSK